MLLIINKKQKYSFIILAFFSLQLLIAQKKDSKEINIEKIEFVHEGYASQPNYIMGIFCDRTVIFYAIRDNFSLKYQGDIVPYGTDKLGNNIRSTEKKGFFKDKLTRIDFKEILNLVNQLDVEFQQQTFDDGQIHHSKGKLIVTYNNKEVKIIYDGGLNGSENLIKLYKMFDALRTESKWR